MEIMKTFKRKIRHFDWRGLVVLMPVLLLCFCVFGCSDDIIDPDKPSLPADTPARIPLNKSDSLIMVKLYNSLGFLNKDWTPYNINSWACLKTGLDDSGKELRITELDIWSEKYTVVFPEDICRLSALKRLWISNEYITGSIPDAIGDLKNLEDLDIRGCRITGKIPESVGKLTKLRRLVIGYMEIGGTIPESIGNLSNLKTMEIINTNIGGEIPKSLANLNTGTMLLYNNKLSGTFPLEVAKNNLVVCSDNNIEELPVEIWRDEDTYHIPFLKGNRISTVIPKWVTEQNNWKRYKSSIEEQQKGYGYRLEQ